jgi:hypothetical protein
MLPSPGTLGPGCGRPSSAVSFSVGVSVDSSDSSLLVFSFVAGFSPAAAFFFAFCS